MPLQHQSQTTETSQFSIQLTLKLSLLASVLLLASCSNSDLTSSYYLAPEPIASGSSVGGVDIASGKLSHSESDLSSSTLSFSRLYHKVQAVLH